MALPGLRAGLRRAGPAEFPSPALLEEVLGPTRTVPVPVPVDCTDGFLLAFWSRPEAVLDPAARAATSGFARMPDDQERDVVERVAADLASGEWDRRHGHLRALPSLDVGPRITVTGLGT